MILRLVCSLVLVGVVACGAQAGSLGPATGFNGFVFTNMDADGGDTEGRLAVGGDLFAKSYAVNPGGGVGAPVSDSHGTVDSLIVGGDLNAPGKWQVFNGNAVYGGQLKAAPTIQAGSGTIRQDTVIDFAAAKADLIALSADLAAYADTPDASAIEQWGGMTMAGTDSDLIVFNVTGSQLASLHTLKINTPTSATVLINVAGTSASMSNMGVFINGVNGGANTNLLFNFHEATTLHFQGIAVPGSVLAPHAALTLAGGGINGQTIVDSANTYWGGEFHNFAFMGDLPEPGESGAPFQTPGVPAPASISAGLLIFAALLGVRRARRCQRKLILHD